VRFVQENSTPGYIMQSVSKCRVNALYKDNWKESQEQKIQSVQ